MSPRHLVSVIVPAHNAGATVDAALESVFWQGYEALEVIVVDDGSTDDTLARLQRWGDRITVLQQRKQGPAAARNLAWRHAKGELIAFIDADDVWLPGKLLAQVAYLQAHPDVDVVFGRFDRWAPADGSNSWPQPPTAADHEQAVGRAQSQAAPGATTHLHGWLYADLLQESHVHIITALVRRSMMVAMSGFDEQWATGSDYEFWLRASRDHRMAQLDQSLAWYRIHPHSITQRPRPVNAEYLLVQRAVSQHGLTGPDGRSVSEATMRRRLHAIAFGHGYLLFWSRQLAWAHRCFSQALSHVAVHPKSWVYWCLTWPAAMQAQWRGEHA